ncbi:T9SS type B sorting domain-containing protein [Flavobacterium sp. 3HN19-14]|uniref:T9SS type B sorting domain-containing protein n=1 Tax=Flavobacterium sp. 3HN19-14 TaxID=3448133 RepID=UPI003EE2F0AC
MCTDSNNDIILSGSFKGQTDFDPSLYGEHIITPLTYELTSDGVTTTYLEEMGFILKLGNCDVQPLYGNQYNFCSGEMPNPTFADIQPKGLNVVWYATPTSPTRLNADFPLTDGQTYYYEHIVDNCAALGRFPLQIGILPASAPPTVALVQPCYFEGIKLSDLNISEQNLVFYAADATETLAPSTTIIAGNTYYVTQNTGNCQSNKIPLSLADFVWGESTYSAGFCDDGSNKRIDLPDHNVYFLPNNASPSDYTFSYHYSYDDADANVNPITNFHNYPASQQTLYVRIYSIQSGCFRVVTLSIVLFSPPVIDDVQVDDMTDNNSITILPFDANYTYSLDGVNFQGSNYFGNLIGGEYTLYIKNGDCPGIPKKVYVLDYPKFFTPNGDGANDTWKVKYSQLQVFFNIEIYDRYGKIITILDKSSGGWDGTYQGRRLPADDYWFRIIRVTNKEIIYRGHFALKR